MKVLAVGGDTVADESAALESNWGAYDSYYLHVKGTDTAGERGDFPAKIQ